MTQPLRIFIGYDSREPLALEVLAHSINRRASGPVSFIPLNVNHLKGIYTREPNGTTEFSLTRFLVPYLSGYEGVSIFMDCDMIAQCDIFDVLQDIAKEPGKAVWCVQHDYMPRIQAKATGAQTAYPRKNWSSFMVFDNDKCRTLSPDYVNHATPSDLHRFVWAKGIGSLPLGWNWLVGEYSKYPQYLPLHVLHYTLGVPAYLAYRDCDHADLWFNELASMNVPLDWWIRDVEMNKTKPTAPSEFPFCASKVYPLGNPTA
jgi:hypothetical protein